MRVRDLSLAILLACVACSAPEAVDRKTSDAGIHLIRGSFEAGRAPDGNTVVLDTHSGLIVFDTGRHAAHVDKIIAYAKMRRRPVVAIINSHWHLDHVSGNPELRKAFPDATVYSHGPALTEALAGFLARGAQSNKERIAEGKVSAGQIEDARRDLATYEARDRLNPTVSLETPRRLAIDGRTLDVHIGKGASAGDIWIYDRKSRLAIVGDLITLPAPFLDTACPKTWRTELDTVLAMPFGQLAPGHGRMMSRADVALYRNAFAALLDCAAGSDAAEACADQWAKAAAPLLDESSGDVGQANAYARYYVENALRRPDARPARCQG